MDTSKYDFDLIPVHGSMSETVRRIKIPRETIAIGQTVFQVDFFYEDGIQELVVRGIEDYIEVTDPQTGESFTRPIKAGETPEGYDIELGEDWSTSPYEKYLTKEDAYEASIEEHHSFVKDNQAMVDRWLISIYEAERRLKIMTNKLKELKEK